MLLPLDDVVNAIGEDNIVGGIKKVCNTGGHYYGLVHAAGTSLLIYRKDLAKKAGVHPSQVTNLCIWGNHSATQYPDLFNAKVDGKAAIDLVDQQWYEDEFIPVVQQRGAAIIKARGASSAASTSVSSIASITARSGSLRKSRQIDSLPRLSQTK